MAEKRMFTNKIVSSDPFKEMPLSAQALYFHLGMNADDEGFLNNAKSVQRSILASEDDMKLLIAKNFIIPFQSGIVVVKHWKMHNTIPPSRIKLTQYTEEKKQLAIKENSSYTLASNTVQADCRQIVDNCLQNAVEIRLDEIRLDEIRLDERESSAGQEQPHTLTLGIYNNVILSQTDLDALAKEFPAEYKTKIDRLSEYMATSGKSYNNHYATIRSWIIEDKKKQQQKDGYIKHNYTIDESQLIDNNREEDDP